MHSKLCRSIHLREIGDHPPQQVCVVSLGQQRGRLPDGVCARSEWLERKAKPLESFQIGLNETDLAGITLQCLRQQKSLRRDLSGCELPAKSLERDAFMRRVLIDQHKPVRRCAHDIATEDLPENL